ncbi:uncharacterized protein LOC109862482 [Pseudomyrmex gracilis]|uniref:uncharacterized protein LOC109862482 n=1 Tax=Pseudomyrmex gracilis TaxID=219809 RepID=UPI000995014C|nr:uncharacterized protein LOC109862482 [Pseudomyrmex gracilis]
MPFYVADMFEDCILGVDFFSKVGIEKTRKMLLSFRFSSRESKKVCCQVTEEVEIVPSSLKELFDSVGLDEAQKGVFADFLNKFQDIFTDQIVAGNCEVLQHKISLQDPRPIKQAPRRVPLGMRSEIEQILHEMREQGVIEESSGPWVSPAVMVKKKDGSLRFCVDYCNLNAVTVKDSYPLLRVDDLLGQLSDNTWFSTLNMKSGYWQVKIRKEDREKTAFSVGNGLWQFTVMPFGLCNAPATFERLMERVLRQLLSKICLVYLDDIIVFGKSFEEMVANLRKVFQRFRERNLKLKPKKCTLLGKQVKRELLAVVDSVKSFHGYLYGRKFLVRTNHALLRWLMSFRDLEGQLARWAEKLQQYNLDIQHRSGKLHKNADGLSRRPCVEFGSKYCVRVEEKEGKEAGNCLLWEKVSAKRPSSRVYWSYWDALVVRDGILHKRWEALNLKTSFLQVIVPRELSKQILEEAHDAPTRGHFAKKGPSDKGKSPLQVYNSEAPFERLQMDILGPFPMSSAENKYLLVIVDCFTKWVEAFLLKNFQATTMAELAWILGSKKTRTTALHPQSDGQMEKQYQTIAQYLSKFVEESQRDWDRWIPMFLLAYRSSRHEATGVTLAELCFGRELRLPLDLLRGTPPNYYSEASESYAQVLREKLDEVYRDVRKRLELRSDRVKMRNDRKDRHILFEVGQKVWFFNPCRDKEKGPKLQKSWEGPFEVRKLSDVVYCIRRSPRHRNKVVHADRLASFCERLEHTSEPYLES